MTYLYSIDNQLLSVNILTITLVETHQVAPKSEKNEVTRLLLLQKVQNIDSLLRLISINVEKK